MSERERGVATAPPPEEEPSRTRLGARLRAILAQARAEGKRAITWEEFEETLAAQRSRDGLARE